MKIDGIEISPEYATVIQGVIDCYKEAGYKYTHSIEDAHFAEVKNRRRGVSIMFDYGSIGEIRIPNGTITPIGAEMSGDENAAKRLLGKRFDMKTIVPMRDLVKEGRVHSAVYSGPLVSVKPKKQ